MLILSLFLILFQAWHYSGLFLTSWGSSFCSVHDPIFSRSPSLFLSFCSFLFFSFLFFSFPFYIFPPLLTISLAQLFISLFNCRNGFHLLTRVGEYAIYLYSYSESPPFYFLFGLRLERGVGAGNAGFLSAIGHAINCRQFLDTFYFYLICCFPLKWLCYAIYRLVPRNMGDGIGIPVAKRCCS